MLAEGDLDWLFLCDTRWSTSQGNRGPVYQEMESSALNENIMFQKGYYGLLGDTHIFVYYPVVSSQIYRGLEG